MLPPRRYLRTWGSEESLAAWLQTHSRVVTRPDGTRAADVINLAFIGGLEELQNAFAAAGWMPAEPLTLHTFSTAYRAYNSMSGYSTAPVSTLLYQGAEPVAVFQKSFNTIAKRHHIRIWSAGTFEGKEVWLGAATHDAGVGFQMASMTITHKIDPETDRERRKVVMDLSFAACSERVSFLDRSLTPDPLGTQRFKPTAGWLSSGCGRARERGDDPSATMILRFPRRVPRPSAWLAGSSWKRANTFFATTCTIGLTAPRAWGLRVRSVERRAAE